MKFRVERSFDRDVDKIKDKKLLKKIRSFISTIEEAASISGILHIRKIEGFDSFYRTKIGDYRLGMEALSDKEVVLVRFLHRKDIYRYFPRRR
ncbi:MAG: type II toxin-antitoxin system RelE/ParE family toxin [Thermodesulfovibrionales bacterium]